MVAEPGSIPGEANRADESNRTGSGNAGPYGMSQPPGFGGRDGVKQGFRQMIPYQIRVSNILKRDGVEKDQMRPWLDHLR